MLRLAPLLLLAGLAARGDDPRPPPAPVSYVDDDAVRAAFTADLGKLADKAMTADALRPLVNVDRSCALALPAPAGRRLDPEDVYDAALNSVLVFGSVVRDNDAWADGRMATAWVLAPGVAVTNWHVLDKAEDTERFGARSRDGRTFPLAGVLAVNKAADIAVVKLAGADALPALRLARAAPRVGSWVGVLGHPGDRYWTFTQGHVSRYTLTKKEGEPDERWMSVTAEYAYGSSGSPVLDRAGNVVGMAALTEGLDYPQADDPADKPKDPPAGDKPGDKEKPPEKKGEPPADPGSRLQMVVKLVTPLADLRRAVGGD